MAYNMSRRGLLGAGAVALAGVPAVARAAGGGRLIFATGTDAVTMDPQMAVDIPSARAFLQIHETLVASGADGTVHGLLAESWTTSADGLTWTFKLRPGVSFHDGTPFDATAVKFNYDRMADPATGSPRRTSTTAGIKAVSVVDPLTVQIVTFAPMAPLMSRLAHYNFAIMSPKAAQAAGKNYAHAPCGTGPFKLGEWVPDERMTLVRNDTYWGTPAKLDAVEFRIVPEDSTRVLMLLSGEAHLVSNVTPALVPRLQGMGTVAILKEPSTRTIYLGMNRNIKPFDNLLVRQAVAAAVDSKSLVDNVQHGFATLGGSFDPAFIPGATALPPYEYDPEKAKKLLAQAGLADGFSADFYFTTGRYANDRQVAEAIQAQLAKVGIKLTMQSPEFGTYMGLIADKHRVGLFMGGKGNPAFDLDGGLSSYISSDGGMNYTGYDNPDLDKLIIAQRSIIDPDKRKVVLKEILTRVHDDVPDLILYYEQQIFGVRSNVHDVVVTPNEYVTFTGATIS